MTTIDTVYLIHHSHTDVGYTHDQQVLWNLYGQFLDEALLLVEKYADDESDAAFRWTVETTAPLVRWLERPRIQTPPICSSPFTCPRPHPASTWAVRP